MAKRDFPKTTPAVAGDHPIASKRYVIQTPEIDAVCDEVEKAVRNRVTGLTFVGRKRLGKTCAISFLKRYLRDKYPGIPIGVWEPPPYERVADGKMFEDMLFDIESAVVEAGRPQGKRRRLLNHFHSAALAASYGIYILIVDEAQNLLERNYRWLIYFSNGLKRRGIDLIVILVGQEELLEQRTGLVQGKKQAIVGRFMERPFKFHGIQSEAQLRACLECYDTESEFPENSGISFTCFYFPEAWRAGWRLSSLAPLIWKECRNISRAATDPEDREIPMQHFCRIVEYLLLNFGDSKNLEPRIGTDEILHAISESGYRNRFDSGSRL